MKTTVRPHEIGQAVIDLITASAQSIMVSIDANGRYIISTIAGQPPPVDFSAAIEGPRPATHRKHRRIAGRPGFEPGLTDSESGEKTEAKP